MNMTEKEAVNRLNNHTQYYVPTEDLEALDMAIEALEEIQEYRKIGTVEECREAVEKKKKEKHCFGNCDPSYPGCVMGCEQYGECFVKSRDNGYLLL